MSAFARGPDRVRRVVLAGGEWSRRASRTRCTHTSAAAGAAVSATSAMIHAPSTAGAHEIAARFGVDVLYGRRSAIWDEAENRLHAQKALLTLVLAA